MLKKIKIQIGGIHCKSCKTLIETEVDVLEGVKDINVDHKSGACKVEFDDQKISQGKIFKTIRKLNYEVSEEYREKVKEDNLVSKKFFIAGILFILFVVGYFLVRYLGFFEILSKLNEQNVSYWLILLIGFLAGFHCVGMCGGLVVTYTARQKMKDKEDKKSFRPHFQYNLGRIVSYTVIGAILGGIGSFFGVNPTFTGVIILIAGIFMILMGLSLFTGFKWLEKIKLKTPDFIAKFLYGQRHTKRPKGPLIIGLLNGFMPCGPLQAMQIYALASGSIIRGALSMGIYAFGTSILMFGFGNFISLISHEKIKQMMKISGLIVIVLGLFMLNRGLTNFGYGFKGLVSNRQTSQTEFLVDGDVSEYQVVNMDLSYHGYEPNVLFIKKGIPVRWVINVKQMSGCTDEIIMPKYNIRKVLSYGENIIEFLPEEEGEIKFSCWMQMVWGKFIVTEDGQKPNSGDLYLETIDLPSGAGCSGNGSCGGSCAAAKTGGCGCGGRIKVY